MNDLAVLIPVYNDASGLVATLDAISESDNSFTVVIVDDGSPEPVVVDASRYPFPIHLIRQAANGGIVKALNTGLEHILEAGFEYVARLDAADLQRPDRLRSQYEHLVSNRELAIVGANVVFREEESNRPLFVTNLPLTSGEIRRWMEFRNCFIHPAVLFRVSLIREVGFYSAAYPHIEDYVLFHRTVQRFHGENIESPLVDCFVRKQGISVRHRRRQLISGIRYKLRHPRLLNPLWYAYLLKRIAYLALPLRLLGGTKKICGFVRAGCVPERPSLAAPR